MKEPEPVAPSFDGTQLCKVSGCDPDLFFPDSADRRQIALAKQICNQCHFQNACLEYALWEPGLEGIWGGTTPRQRETMRTKLRKYRAAV